MLAVRRSSAPGRLSPPAWFRVAAVFVGIARRRRRSRGRCGCAAASEFSNLDSRIQTPRAK